MKAVYKYPGENAEIININNDLTTLQHLVDGYIEVVRETVRVPATGNTFEYALILNEEGKLRGLQENVFPANQAGDVYVGPVVCVGVDDDEFTDIPYEWAQMLRVFLDLRSVEVGRRV